MNARILVVDDEHDVADFCMRVLRRFQYEAESAATAQAALALLREKPFDLLISDMMMPGISGIELLQQARQIRPNLPMIVITGYGSTELAIKALKAGAQDFLPKPFGVNELREAVEHTLKQARDQQEYAQLRALLPLFELSKRSLCDTSLDELLDQIVTLASKSLADGAAIFLLDEASQEYKLRARKGAWPTEIVTGEAVPAALRDAADPKVVTQATALTSEATSQSPNAHGVSIAWSPLCVQGQQVGVWAWLKARAAFQEADVELLTVMSSQIAALVQNKRLVERLENWNRELENRVTEATRKLLEAQERLLRSERLATIGKLGASVAHELRNPLGVINNSVYYLKARLGDTDAKVSKHLGIISHEVAVSNKIITDLMSFVRVGDIHAIAAEPRELVQQTLERALLPENVHVRTELAPDLPVIAVDVDKVQQVFLNLVNNAVQAMPQGGDLTIRVDKQNGHVRFHFCDTGLGIAPEDQQRIFEPLYTTKAKGIGLGLAVVQMLVDAHHGEVSVSSKPGEGACFCIKLPHLDGKAQEKRTA